MVATSSPAVLKRWIAFELTKLRNEAGKERAEVQQRTGLSRAQVGHLETAKRLPSKLVLEAMLDFYGKPERINDFLRLVEAAHKGKNWWEHLKAAVPPWFNLFLGLESGAAELSSIDVLLITGLLQTPEYAEAVIRADTDLTDDEVRQRVELRIGRQRILDRDPEHGPVRLWTVLDESVLYRRRGDSAVMRAQLDHLLEMSERPRVDIQVLPLSAGTHPAQQGGTFTVMKFPSEMKGDPGVVYHELLNTGLYIEEQDEISLYERTLRHVHALAATPEDSRGIIERARKEV